MQKCSILGFICLAFSLLISPGALAENVVVGVNVVGVDRLSEAQQDALVEQLRRDGVTTVRTSFGPAFEHFIIHAYQNGIGDLNSPSDSEGRAIAKGYLAYLRVVAKLKDVRDHSRLNQETPILSAGLATSGQPGKKPGWKIDGVSAAATLEFWQQHGIDKLVDGYGVHAYTANHAG